MLGESEIGVGRTGIYVKKEKRNGRYKREVVGASPKYMKLFACPMQLCDCIKSKLSLVSKKQQKSWTPMRNSVTAQVTVRTDLGPSICNRINEPSR